MKKTFTGADSPVNVLALMQTAAGSSSTTPILQNQPVEEIFLGVATGEDVTFNLPAISALGGTLNQKIAIVTLGAGATATIQPDADDTICTLGTGIASAITGLGNSVILQPVFDHVWHSGENAATGA